VDGPVDTRAFLGVPNFLDVASNAPFVAVGLLGLRAVARGGAHRFEKRWERAAAALLFLGVALVAFGSAWFHLDPTRDRLVWDRLPMTLVFTSLAAIVVADRASEPAGRVLFVPLVIAGVASVILWRQTGIVWPYAAVQYGPLAAFPVMLALRRPRYEGAARWLVAALLAYGAAKFFEIFDREIFALGRVVSGHTLKHLAAAASAACLVAMIAKRRVAAGGPGA
jgi:ceramidase